MLTDLIKWVDAFNEGSSTPSKIITVFTVLYRKNFNKKELSERKDISAFFLSLVMKAVIIKRLEVKISLQANKTIISKDEKLTVIVVDVVLILILFVLINQIMYPRHSAT